MKKEVNDVEDGRRRSEKRDLRRPMGEGKVGKITAHPICMVISMGCREDREDR